MHLQHLRYTSGFCPCTVPFVFGCMAVHIFFPPLVTADCTGWYNFLPTTIYLWLISLTSSKELSILLLKLYNDGAIGISNTFLDSASVIKTDNQLLIRSVRFMQVESP